MIKRKVIITIFLSLFTLAWISAQSQTITINAVLDSSSILIGDQVKLRFEFDQPVKARLQLPFFSDTISGQIQVIKSLPADTIKKGENLHIRKAYLLTSFDSGIHKIPSIALPIEIGKLKDTMYSSALQLKVHSLPVDTTKDIRDIRPPLKAPLTFRELWPYLAGGLLIILIVIIIWYFIVYRKKGRIFGSPKISEPPHIKALHELDHLRAEKLWQSGKEKLYYTKLTEIIRVYIEHRFGIYALEMTSDEIINALNSIIVEEKASIELIKNMFSIADLVKFAKVLPLPDENEIGLLNAYQFVNNTKPIVSQNQPVNESSKESN